jgi:hypothetical protein
MRWVREIASQVAIFTGPIGHPAGLQQPKTGHSVTTHRPHPAGADRSA